MPTASFFSRQTHRCSPNASCLIHTLTIAHAVGPTRLSQHAFKRTDNAGSFEFAPRVLEHNAKAWPAVIILNTSSDDVGLQAVFSTSGRTRLK